MKKIQILILLFFVKSYAQEVINFKVAYQPNNIYRQTTSSDVNSNTIYLGSDEILKRIKEKGLQNPEIKETKSLFKNTNKTGKLKKNKFSLSIEFTESPNVDVIPNGTILYGSVETGNKPEFESLYSPKMEKETKKILFNSIQSMINQVTFPEKRMKIGDSFLREMPLNIPLGGDKVIKMQNTIIYKLIKIESDLAYFDIVQDYTFDSSINDIDLFASGNGTGTLIYDIKNTFYLDYKLDSNLHYEINHQNLKAIAKTKTSFEQSTVISNNN